MKILLAYTSGMPDRKDPYISLLPTGLCLLHSCLREAGYDATLANFSGWPDSAIQKQLQVLKPDIAGISQWTHNRCASLVLARNIREASPNCTLVMGGAHATFCYEELLRHESLIDCVILGEGEETLLEFVCRIKNGVPWHDVRGIAYRSDGSITVTPRRAPLKDLDELPSAAKFLKFSIGVDLQLQPEFILTTRGCPSSCHFCSSPKFWERKIRFRSPQKIVEEMMYICDRYGLIYFSLRDDTFTADRARTISFCKLLIEKQAYVLWNCQSRVSVLDEELLIWMKRAGCECIQLGVESGSSRVLSMLGKSITPAQVEQAGRLIRKVGINLSIYLISDVPGETEKDLQDTLQLIQHIRPDDGYVSPLAYFPGTWMFEKAVESGYIARTVFETGCEQAIYVAGKPGPNSRLLLKAIGNAAPHDSGRFKRQKEFMGYCYTTNILAGEFYRLRGDYRAAEKEFKEIIKQEPGNPWGWYLLGELCDERGIKKQAQECYAEVCRIIPAHVPSRQGMQV